MLDFQGELNKEILRLPSKEHMLGKGLYQPFANTNSGARKVMFGTQLEHAVPLVKPEVPIAGTGYEIRFGDRSSSILKAEDDFTVIAKIPKFEQCPGHHYSMIIQYANGLFDVIERKEYEHTTEMFGYRYNFDAIDKMDVGSEGYKGEILRKSTSYDEVMNRMDGTNLLTGYINKLLNQEDGIIIADTAAVKLSSSLIKVVEVPVNDNDIMVNLMGNDNVHKAFPDIGQELKNNILCAVRREKIEDSLYTHSKDRLRTLLMSDEKYTLCGRVVDIDITCNNPDMLKDRPVHSQLLYYYQQRMKFNDKLVETIDMHRDDQGKIKMSYKLNKLYNHCLQELRGDQFTKDRPDKPFGGLIIKFVVIENNTPKKGDKITNRYGGKGVISAVIPLHEMPLLEDGRHLEVIYNGSTCVNRLNAGQLMECSSVYYGARLTEHIGAQNIPTADAITMVHDYLEIISPEEAEEFLALMYDESADDIDREWYIDEMVKDRRILFSNKPMSESLTLDQLNKLRKRFPFIRQYKVAYLTKDSAGKQFYRVGHRRITAAEIYTYRLKQYAEEKFSVTSLSSTNIRNENTKSKSNKNYKTLNSNTPIKFGNMEISHLDHAGTSMVIELLMIHSVSPEARVLMEQALTGDPYEINIQLDDKCKNRQVEIFRPRFKTLGLRIGFRKIPKKTERAFTRRAFSYIPVLPRAFSHMTDEEYENLDLEEYANYQEEMVKMTKQRAFIRKAFSYIEEKK